MLDDFFEDRGAGYLITRSPRGQAGSCEVERFETGKINSFFMDSLHAKIYAFRLDREKLKPDQQKYKNFVAVGSANLTWPGINPKGLRNDNIQYELSYEIPEDHWEDVEMFLLHVAHLG